MIRFIIFIIKAYQSIISPVLSRFEIQCRFYPSCSNYAILAIKKYGIAKGTRKTLDRLLRCRPDNPDSCIDFP